MTAPATSSSNSSPSTSAPYAREVGAPEQPKSWSYQTIALYAVAALAFVLDYVVAKPNRPVADATGKLWHTAILVSVSKSSDSRLDRLSEGPTDYHARRRHRAPLHTHVTNSADY